MPIWNHCRKAFAWVNLLPARVIVAISTLGPIGRWGRAPGTNGSAAGIVYFYLVYVYLATPSAIALALLAASVYLAIAFCDAAEIRLGLTDPGFVILDEFVAMPFCFFGVFHEATQRHWPGLLTLLAGFALFRFFDILKPLGINRLQRLPGGLGVVMDDLAAALATCVVLNVMVRLT
jgi:phosphatidylglycerophosphatase A